MSEISDFLSKYKIPDKENEPTFLQIARFPRRETVWSNIIRFYLNDKSNGMNNFLLECIGNCLDKTYKLTTLYGKELGHIILFS